MTVSPGSLRRVTRRNETKKKTGPRRTAASRPMVAATRLARAYPPMLLTWFAASTRERIRVPSETGNETFTTLSAAGLKKMKTKSPRNERTRKKTYDRPPSTAATSRRERAVRRRSDDTREVRIRKRSMKGPETALIRISEM